MAVMTTLQTDGVAFEHKLPPVPSSDKMALDLDINGFRSSIRDETTVETTYDDPPLSKPEVESISMETTTLEVNGTNNGHAFASNHSIVPDPIDFESQSALAENSSISVPESSQLLDTNTTTTDIRISTSPKDQELELSSLPTAESTVDLAVEDTTASTSVPLVIEAQESDLRSATSPVAPLDSNGEQPQPDLGAPIDLSTAHVESPTDIKVDAEEFSFETSSTNADLPPTQQPETAFDQLSLQHPGSQPSSSVENTMALNDVLMAEAPEPSTKVAREREEDDETGPSAKRTKTEDETMVDSPLPTQNGETASAHSGDTPLTDFQVKEYTKVVKNVARNNAGKNFRAPVSVLWPTFAEAYAAKISNEIDLLAIENKLKDRKYTSKEDFKADLQLLYDNALAFNGLNHTISNAALEVRDQVLSKTASIPSEPAAAPKKQKPVKRSTPSADLPPRNRGPSKAPPPPPPVATPAAAPTPTTFALDPTTNTPLIRRDSTKDGRPKREIHPPKNKDLPYNSVKPRPKKHATELKFCEEVITELRKPKYSHISVPFLIPVDPVALNIPNYFTTIKKPMDVSTVANKLNGGAYSTPADFEKDVRQIFKNCFLFNPPGNPVRVMGEQLKAVFEEKWAEKDQWIADHSPVAASPDSDVESSEDEEEDEDVASTSRDTLSLAKERLLEEQQKLINLMSAKHKDEGMISMQQEMVEIITKRIKNEEAGASQKKAKKAKAPKPVKKAATQKKTAPAPKKASGARQNTKYMGTLEKETISNGLGSLPDDICNEVLLLIRNERPDLDTDDDGNLELDIDAISTPLLWKIYGLVMEYAPEVEAGLRSAQDERETPRAVAKPPPKKKNKPMSKTEQERKIEHLTRVQREFQQKQGSGSQEPVPTVEQQDSSGDEDSDSEEE